MADTVSLLTLGAVAAGLATQATAPDGPFAPDLLPGRRAELQCRPSPTVYAVHARVDPAALTVNARVGVAFTNTTERATRRLVLRVFANHADAADVQLSAVHVDGHPSPHELRDTLLVVPLASPLAPGKTVQLDLAVAQRIPPVPEPAEVPEAVTARNTGAYGHQDDVINLGYWLPQLTHYGPSGWDDRPLPHNGEHAVFDPAMWQVTLDLPADWVAATTGVSTRETVGKRLRRNVYVAAQAREFAIEASPRFHLRRGTVDGTEIRAFSADPVVAERLLIAGIDALRFFNARFGPLPQRELDLVDAPVSVALGTEFPGIATIDASAGTPEDHAWTVVHEVAHQWWYGRVGNDQRDAPWLDESLASWSAGHFWADRYGRAWLDAGLGEQVIAASAVLADHGDLPTAAPGEDFALPQYGAIVYLRGSLFFQRLEDQAGAAALERALRRYHAERACQMSSKEDLLRALEADIPNARALFAWWMEGTPGFAEMPAKSP